MMPRLNILFLLIFLILSAHAAVCQQDAYRITQSFRESTGNQPPAGWRTTVPQGDPGLVEWRFDNPGSRTVSFPVLPPFAILDAAFLAETGDLYSIALESPQFFVTPDDNILLTFDHLFVHGSDATVSVQAYNGSTWVEIPSSEHSSETSGVMTEIIDLTDFLRRTSGYGTARIRFVWQGSNEGYWAVDNVRIYAAFALDAGLSGFASPIMPFQAGEHPISVDLVNFGSQPLTSAGISWVVDGQPEQSTTWVGSLGFGETATVNLTSYTFTDRPVRVEAWLTSANGSSDPNPQNDTIVKTFQPAMQGAYTIGGATPDFVDFEAAAAALNTAGVAGHVVFRVRPGEYENLVFLGRIPGTSPDHTILFEAETGDAANTRLINRVHGLTALNIRGSQHIHFRGIGFSGHNAVLLDEQAGDVSFHQCRFLADNAGVTIRGGTGNVRFDECDFSGGNHSLVIGDANTTAVQDIEISGCRLSGARIRAMFINRANGITVNDNHFAGTQQGLFAYQSNNLTISNNRIHVVTEFVNENTGIRLENTTAATIYNNYITATGLARASGIRLLNSTGNKVYYNSVNLATSDVAAESKALWLDGSLPTGGSQANDFRNNIFHIAERGFPVFFTGNIGTNTLNYNNHHHPRGLIGRVGGSSYDDLSAWQAATGQDANSISVIPFFSSLDDPTVNQSALKGAASSAIDPVVNTDIDGDAREDAPTIGAKEFIDCATDAGINGIVQPTSPVAGNSPIRVTLKNHGTESLHSVDIHWRINDGEPQTFPWLAGADPLGLVPAGVQRWVTIAPNHDFSSGGLFAIEVWTANPNGLDDCKKENDRYSKEISGALCGDYTIYGTDPDFENFNQAILALNTAGISCDVTFYVRPGTYEEQFVINDFLNPGDHTVTFEAESGPGTVIIEFPYWQQAPVRIAGGRNIHFNGIRLRGHHALVIEEAAQDLRFELCHFSVHHDPAAINNACVEISGGSANIHFERNHFEDGYHSIKIFRESGLTETVNDVHLINNLFESAWHEAISINPGDHITIDANLFRKIRRGVLAGATNGLTVSNNYIYIDAVATEDNLGLYVAGGTTPNIYNNFIAGAGPASTTGIRLTGVQDAKISHNSIHIATGNVEGINRALQLSGGSGNRAYNNIFKVTRRGYPVWIEDPGSTLSLDHNNYFGPGGHIGMVGDTPFSDLVQWQNATGQDAASLSVDPFFSNEGPHQLFPDDGPAINQVLLSGSGTYIPGILHDIAGDPRDPDSPDIGARVYETCDDDAGINRIIAPTGLVAGEQEVTVELQNHGHNDLASVTIRWEVNGVEQPHVDWLPSPPAAGLAQRGSEAVTLGSITFVSGAYTIRAWTDRPNGGQDCNDTNDEARITVQAGLNGIYTIGGSDADFPDFVAATEALNTAGVSGDVTFRVRNGIYNNQFVIADFARSDTTAVIRFEAESREGLRVEIIQPMGVEFVAKILGATDIQFEGIYFEGLDAVIIEDNARGILFDRCAFTASRIGVEIREGSNITLMNSLFTRGENAIVLRPGLENIQITGNTFNGQAYQAIHSQGVINLVISDNRFDPVGSGMLIMDAENVVVGGNWISMTLTGSAGKGVEIRRSSRIDLFNNFVYSNLQISSTGIEWINNEHSRLYHNTVNLTGGHPGSKALFINGGSDIDVMNNILCADKGFPLFIEPHPAELYLSHNNYYNTDGIIGYTHGKTITSRDEWRNENKDHSSELIDPAFFPEESPIHNDGTLKHGAQFTNLVSRDLFGVMRNPGAPAIGCYEPFIDFGITDLQLPDFDCNIASMEEVTVHLFQSGFTQLDTLTVMFRVNDLEPQTIKVTGFSDYQMPWTFQVNIDLTEPGTYRFEAWLPEAEELGDQFPYNDTIVVTRIRPPSPDVTVSFEYACEMVHFNGSAEVSDDDPVLTALWNFGDGSSGDDPVTSHSYSTDGPHFATFTVTTQLGCVVERGVEVQASITRMDVNEIVSQSCFGMDNGSVELTITGGLAPYVISINNNETEPITGSTYIHSGLWHGDYTFHVIDLLNCETVIETAISNVPRSSPQIAAPDSVYIPVDVTVAFDADHTDYFRLVWTNIEAGEQFEGVDAPVFRFDEVGTYTITLEVFSGPLGECYEMAQHVIVAKLEPLTLDVQVTQQYCQAEPEPSVILAIGGGVPPFGISINDQDPVFVTDTNWSMPNPVSGQEYHITVTDAYEQFQQYTTYLAKTTFMDPVISMTDNKGNLHDSTYNELIPIEATFSVRFNDLPESVSWQIIPEPIAAVVTNMGDSLMVRFESPGDFRILLEARSGEPGYCVEIAEFRVIAGFQVEITTNDIITPNGDGDNDYFEVITKGIREMQVDIFDRRGRRVSRFSDLDGKWDGNFPNGRQAPDGMYPYYISATGYDGLSYEKSGMIQLIREVISIFPNPATGSVTIDLKGMLDELVDIDVIDLRSNVLLSVKGQSANHPIALDVSGLQEGIYLIRISDRVNVFHSKLWVIR